MQQPVTITFFRHPIFLAGSIFFGLLFILLGKWLFPLAATLMSVDQQLATIIIVSILSVCFTFGCMRYRTVIDPEKHTICWRSTVFGIPVNTKTLRFGDIRVVTLIASRSSVSSYSNEDWAFEYIFAYSRKAVVFRYFFFEIGDSLMGAVSGIYARLVDHNRQEYLFYITGNEKRAAKVATEVSRIVGARLGV